MKEIDHHTRTASILAYLKLYNYSVVIIMAACLYLPVVRPPMEVMGIDTFCTSAECPPFNPYRSNFAKNHGKRETNISAKLDADCTTRIFTVRVCN